MAKDAGWIKLYRSSFNNHLYFSEPFTRWQAWVDLLLLANHKDGYVIIRQQKITVLKGQIALTSFEFARRWKWSRGKVLRFLDELETEQQIVQRKNNISTLISIVNYKRYQIDGTADSTADGTANGTANGTTEINKKEQQTVQQTVQQNNDITPLFTMDNELENKKTVQQTTQQTVQQKSTKTVQRNAQQTDTYEEYKEVKKDNPKTNSEGVPPPQPPVFVVPDKFYLAEDFNGLPSHKNEEIIRFVKIVHKKEIQKEEVDGLWEIFKSQTLTGTKPYLDKNDVYRHFFNVTTKRAFKTERTSRVKKSVSQEKVYGMEYINDFTQCKMSDGSVQDLDENQRSMAKFQGIKPNVIVKK